MTIRFGEYELDEPRLMLCRLGERVELRPKVFDLLAYLTTHRARVVRREELVEALWDATSVGAGSLSGLVNELRHALGEKGHGPSSIRTVHARGYQFVASIEGAGLRGDTPEAPPREGGRANRVTALFERVAEYGACGVVVEADVTALALNAGERDAGNRLGGELGALVAHAEQTGFEVYRLYSPDESMSSSARFASQIIDLILAARGREAVVAALPLPARVWLEESAARTGAGGVSSGSSSGPSDPLGSVSSLLSQLSRRRPIVMVVEEIERAGSRLARDLVALSRRLDRDPVLWVATTKSLSLGGAWLRVLEGDGGFGRLEHLGPRTTALDQSLRRLGLDPLPSILVEALQAHVEGRGEAVEAIANWISETGNSSDSPAEGLERNADLDRGWDDRVAPTPGPMRTVTPWRASSRRRSIES
jgi:DNA-binding winged helix-turn-helix (wHTH) protein